MQTSWPSGAALPRPRKRRKRPVGKVVREERKMRAVAANVERNGTKFVPKAMLGVCPPDEPRERCGDPDRHPSVRRVGVDHGKLIGAYRVITLPNQADPNIRAGLKLARKVRAGILSK